MPLLFASVVLACIGTVSAQLGARNAGWLPSPGENMLCSWQNVANCGITSQYMTLRCLSLATIWDDEWSFSCTWTIGMSRSKCVVAPGNYSGTGKDAHEAMDEAAKLCRLHLREPRQQMARLFDALFVSNQMDMLEVRMQELYHVVEGFIVIESMRSPDGHLKPTFFQRNAHRFTAYQDKIHHMVVDSMRGSGPADQRLWLQAQLLAAGLNVLSTEFNKGDLLILGDIEQVPKLPHVLALVSCRFDEEGLFLKAGEAHVLTFRQVMDKDVDPQLVIKADGDRARFVLPANASQILTLSQSAWHCSLCHGSAVDVLFDIVLRQAGLPANATWVAKEINWLCSLLQSMQSARTPHPSAQLDAPTSVLRNPMSYTNLLSWKPHVTELYSPAGICKAAVGPGTTM